MERFLGLNTLSAALFGLASYGLLGLWLSPERWRAGLPAALLLVGALPFGTYSQVYLGYPTRILTARVISAGLGAIGVPAVGVDTILTLEHGVAQVDLPQVEERTGRISITVPVREGPAAKLGAVSSMIPSRTSWATTGAGPTGPLWTDGADATPEVLRTRRRTYRG